MFNKDKLTGYAAGLITAVLLCSSAAFAQSIEKTITAVYNNIKIIVNGEEITPTDVNGNIVEPFIADGTTYLPVRALANALGQEVFWDGETNSVYIGEMPEKEEVPETEPEKAYSVNNKILNKFSDLTLMNVGKSGVKGSFFNLYIATAVNDVYFPYQCDNYSPDATLQTMTIGSQKAAQVLTEDITDTYHTLYSVYNAAQKEGFTNDEAVKSAQSIQWEQFKAQFENDGKFNEFLTVHSISENDLKEYMSVYTVYNLYSEKLIGEYLSKTYTESELLKAVDKEYAKVKHILVEDEATAKSIISKLGKGASFDSLVKEYSTDPGQGEDGYTFTKGEMVKEFEDAAFSLNKNSYTKTPVKSAYGYHIIYRYPLSSEWIDENKANFTQIAASSSYREKIDALLESTKISYTQNYQKYISTIE